MRLTEAQDSLGLNCTSDLAIHEQKQSDSSTSRIDLERKLHDSHSFPSRLIYYASRRLCRQKGFSSGVQKDIEQELRLHLLNQIAAYDPSRAQVYTFFARIVSNKVASMRRHRQARKRLHQSSTVSLNRNAKDFDGHIVAYSELIDSRSSRTHRQQYSRSTEEVVQLREDIKIVLDCLPIDQRNLATRLMRRSVSQVAKDMGVSRQKIYREIAKLRKRFVDHDLADYV